MAHADTITVQVPTDVYNATERADGTNFTTDNDLGNTNIFVGWSGAGFNWDSAQCFVVAIPQGATINSATETVIPDTTASPSAFSDTIFAEAVDDAQDFTANPTVIGRSVSTSSVAWTTPTSETAGTGITSPDITSLIQETVDRTGWSSGNHLCLIHIPTGTGTNFTYTYYSLNSANAASLHVDFTSTSTPSGLATSTATLIVAAVASTTANLINSSWGFIIAIAAVIIALGALSLIIGAFTQGTRRAVKHR